MVRMSAIVRRHVVVSGRVQGVWFRDTCRQEARLRDVHGWVRNLPDGRVEAVFEGEPEAVDTLVAWCHQGSRGAVVRHVEVSPEEPEGLQGFEVLR